MESKLKKLIEDIASATYKISVKYFSMLAIKQRFP